jgi:hypothetical protein
LVETGVNDPYTGSPYTDAGSNPHTRSTDTGGHRRPYHASFGYADRLAINDGRRGDGRGTQTERQH